MFHSFKSLGFAHPGSDGCCRFPTFYSFKFSFRWRGGSSSLSILPSAFRAYGSGRLKPLPEILVLPPGRISFRRRKPASQFRIRTHTDDPGRLFQSSLERKEKLSHILVDHHPSRPTDAFLFPMALPLLSGCWFFSCVLQYAHSATEQE